MLVHPNERIRRNDNSNDDDDLIEKKTTKFRLPLRITRQNILSTFIINSDDLVREIKIALNNNNNNELIDIYLEE